MYIGEREIGPNAPVFIVAEAGTAHLGQLERGYELIDGAAAAGADCIKFQAVIADEIIHPLSGQVELPGGRVDLYRKFKELERDAGFYRQLKEYTEKKGLVFLCSAFGLESARLLHSLEVDALKIASPELNHFILLKEAASYKLPLILSTGVSTLADIENALVITGEMSILLHCVTAYPAPEEEYNLNVIPNMGCIFGRLMGISDHSKDPLLVPVLAVCCGSVVIEKHLTLSATAGGLDDVFALDPEEFSLMVRAVRRAEKEGEEANLERMSADYGRERVLRVLGSGVKELAAAEAGFYCTTNRSIQAWKAIAEGEVITGDNIAVLRSEKNLIPGLAPEYLQMVLGRQARRDIPAGAGLSWEDL